MIGKILKNIRNEAKLSQVELGKRLSMRDTTISSYERENSQPDFETIVKVAKIGGYEILFKDKNGNIYTVGEMSKERDF